jgi:hypothetical protein
MPRTRLTFRQRDLKAALKAARDAGIPVARIKVTADGVEITAGDPVPSAAPDIDPETAAMDEAVRNAKF